MICLACHKKGGPATDKCPFCGTPYTAASSAVFSDEFHLAMDKEAMFDFHVKNIDMDFDMDCVHRMNKALGIGKTADYEDDDTKKPSEDPPPEPVPPLPEEPDESGQKEQKTYPPVVKTAIRIGGGISLLLVLIFALWGIFFYLGTWQPFQKALHEGDYEKAVEIYDRSTNKMFRSKAEKSLTSQADAVLEAYRNGEITGQEARSKLDALSLVSGSSDDLADVYSEAAEIERSKKAYQEGLLLYQAGDYVSAMEAWSGISEKDPQSSAEAKRLLEDEKVKKALNSEISAQVNGEGNMPSSRLMQALVFLKGLLPEFPNLDTSIAQLEPLTAKEYGENGLGNGTAGGQSGESFDLFAEDVEINRNAPVKIMQIKTTRPNVEGGIDLFIRWQNRSGQTISRIIFIVKPTNEFGTVMNCRKQGYSTYYAIDKGPYENGKGTPSDTWKWSNAWFNPLISKAELMSVHIEYGGNNSITISDPETLNALFE